MPITRPATGAYRDDDEQDAFAYLRVSGKGQVDGDGFPRQLAAIKKYAAEQDIKIVQVFREKGVSGTKDLADRPAFIEMMTALHGDGVKLVLVEKVDRLARDLMVQETIIGDLRKHAFELSPWPSRICCRMTPPGS